MRALSELSNSQLLELIESIKEKNGGETNARNWSKEDIDRLLELTDRGQRLGEIEHEPETVDEEILKTDVALSQPESEAESVDFEALEQKAEPSAVAKESTETVGVLDISEPPEKQPEDARLKSIMNDEAPVKRKPHFEKNLFGSVFGKIKKSGEGLLSLLKKISEESEKNTDLDLELESETVDVELYEDEEESDSFDGEKTKTIPAMEIDEVTREVCIEKPGIVIKKGESQEDLEGAPIIMSAEDALDGENGTKNEKIIGSDFNNKMKNAELEGQLVFDGMESGETVPEQIDESEAEKELFEKRKEKISKFALIENDDNDPYGADSEGSKIGDLFAAHEERPRRKESDSFVGIEYSQTKDARRVIRYLNTQRKRSLNKIVGLGVIFALILIISIASAVPTTIAGDRILTIFSNFVLLCLGLVVANQTIVNSFELLKKKKININTLISASAIICFFQNLMMLIFYFAENNTVSVFSGAGVALLLVAEINNYLVHTRTVEAMEMCTGDNKDCLYSIEGITDDKDAVELAKNVKNSSPRIRFSCKTKFPARLIELCMSENSVDKNAKTLLPLIAIFALINLIVAWIVKGDFATGFAAFSITFSMCVPAYASLLYELPLSRTNARFNKEGGMISCQDAVNELCRTNVVIIDSKDLFDQKACVMHGFKDFKNVRLDDAMLYAAAMVIRSGGPLTGVFDQVVVNRHDILPAVKSFSYEEKQGISGWIFGQKVVLGNKLMMVNHNIEIPESVDEGKYLIAGHEVMYLGIAHKLAAMIVVDYAPNEQIRPYLKMLRDSGVNVLVRNCDPNVTEAMISSCYDMRLNNIKILNSSSGRIYKKYKSRPRMSTKAIAIHDGTPYTFLKSLCLASSLRQMFRISNLLSLLGILMGFVIVLILSAINVICDLPEIFILLMQVLVTLIFIGIERILDLGNNDH